MKKRSVVISALGSTAFLLCDDPPPLLRKNIPRLREDKTAGLWSFEIPTISAQHVQEILQLQLTSSPSAEPEEQDTGAAVSFTDQEVIDILNNKPPGTAGGHLLRSLILLAHATEDFHNRLARMLERQSSAKKDALRLSNRTT